MNFKQELSLAYGVDTPEKGWRAECEAETGEKGFTKDYQIVHLLQVAIYK